MVNADGSIAPCAHRVFRHLTGCKQLKGTGGRLTVSAPDAEQALLGTLGNRTLSG